MKRAALVLTLLVCTMTTRAADKWVSIRSKNFLLVGNASESQIRDIAENLELFRTAYGKFFQLGDSASTVGTTVLVFKSDAAFRSFKPVYQGKPANISGFFLGGRDRNFIALSADIETPRVIYHEYVHRLMADNLANLPPWFQEGFAECFSTLEIEGRDRKIRMGRAIAEHVELLSGRRFMPLEQLFAVTPESREYNEAEKQGLFYAESWAFVHYMMLGPQDRREKFFEFLNGLNKGTPAVALFQKVFQTDLASFQKVFEAYIQQRVAWPALELSSPGALDRDKDITARVLSEAEFEYYLGDLLLHMNRLQEAETHLKIAVLLDPMHAGAQAATGRLLLRQKNETEAMEYLRRGTELDPGNYLTHYYYASSIQSRNRTLTDEDWNIIRSELLKTIELAPHFVAATEMLADLNLTRNTEIPQTINILRKARTFAPGNHNLVVMLAFALARTPERESARPLVESVLRNTSLDPTMRKNAETVLNFLNQDSASENGLPVGIARMRGTLTLIECTDRVTLFLTVDGKTLKFDAPTLDKVRFILLDSVPASRLQCGPLPGDGLPATMIYRPVDSSDSIGEALIVEFGETSR